MFRILARILTGFLAAAALLIIALLVLSLFTFRRSFPETQGEIRLEGLGAPVDILRDGLGIPQIYASTTHDLFFAQGYVHAQDRFYQMDYWRRLGSGRLAEMLGEPALDADRFLRTMGWERIARQELESMDEATRSLLQAYADGVNAYLAGRSPADISAEYAILKLTRPAYQPEPWEPVHTLTWAKAMAWNLGSNLDTEIEAAILRKTLTPAQLEELYPPFPEGYPVIVPDFQGASPPNRQAGQAPYPYTAVSPLLAAAGRQFATLEGVLGPHGRGIGSNSWVISGQRTATGMPFLANDPHLAQQIPSIWYQVGLHCLEKGEACPFDVTGFSFAGAPGVIIGHNDRIAWGFTNVGPDVMDLYIERINPVNPRQYEVNGQWVDMQVYHETLQVAGGDPVSLEVRLTRHGPLITDTYLPEDFSQQAGVDLPASYAVALRWTALEPSALFRAVLNFDRAQNWEEFRAAAQDMVVPAQNLVYADVDGNIGYQMPGWVPVRAAGDGKLPAPGWTDEYEWTRVVPFDELPYTFNPPQGFIATANQAVVGPQYPFLISNTWDYGFRAQRINELIQSAPGPIDIAYIQHMQGDNYNLNAKALVPVLLQAQLEDEGLEGARQVLRDWDFQEHMDSAPAALFEVFWARLVANTFNDDLPEDYWLIGDDRAAEIVRRLLGQPDSPWWDDRNTPEVEGRDRILSRALAEAVTELERAQGTNPQRWSWGTLHVVNFRHQSLGATGIPLIDALFNRGPYRSSGTTVAVNATSWSSTSGSYEVRWLPSMRMIVDLGNLDNSLAIHTTGQSGHPFHPHYVDMADQWRAIQYHPMLWSRAQVEAAAVDRLRLVP